MAEQPLKNKTAITGVGWTSFSFNSGKSVLDLAAEASLRAIDDAGLTVRDVDGVMTCYWQMDTIHPRELVVALGLPKVNFSIFSGMAGTWTCGAVLAAAMAVFAGVCRNVLVFRAANFRSQRSSHGEPKAVGPAQFTLPYGALHAADNFGHRATAHMARFGTTSLDMAHLAVTQRQHALLNKKAVMQKPITIEDHQASRWIDYPYRLLDCCVQTDAAVALIVSSAEQARDMKHRPVYIMAGMGGDGPTAGRWETHGALAAPTLYAGAGVTPNDVDVAELYDPFTLQCMIHMEDFGLVPKGEVGPWVSAGKNALDGETPVNTHGGLLSEAYVHGLNHVIEAVQQLRPEGVIDDRCAGPHTYDRATCRQVKDAEIALVCSEEGRSSLLLRRE